MTLLARIFVNSWWRTMGLKSAKEALDPYRAKIRELEAERDEARFALIALVQQIDRNDFTDSLGHIAKMLKAFRDAGDIISRSINNE